MARSTVRRCPSRRTGRGHAACDRLRAIAAQLFISRGYEHVSLDEIVQAAGGSKTNIYAFFGGKEGLFIASVEHACRDVLRPLAEAETDGLSLDEGLTRLGRALLDALLTPRALGLHRTVIGESGRLPKLGAVWYAAGPGFSQKVFADFIALARPGRADAAGLARLFHDMVAGDLQHRAMFEAAPAGEAARTQVVREAVAAISALVAARDAQPT